MKKTFLITALFLLAACVFPAILLAAADQYIGDTAIYNATPNGIQPNVLIIIDTSGSMSNRVPSGSTITGPYDPGTIYPTIAGCGSNNNSTCSSTAVYTRSNQHYNVLNSNINNITNSCGTNGTPHDTLINYGVYTGQQLNSNGSCKNTNNTVTYYYGNYVNWLLGTQGIDEQKIVIAKRVINNLLATTNGVSFGLMKFNSTEGGRFLSQSVAGGSYVTTIKNMDDIFSGTSTTTNRYALMSAVNSLSAGGYTPLGEALYEGLRYFEGGESAFGNTIGLVTDPTTSLSKYPSPIQWSCQQNFIIMVTDGMSNQDDNAVLDTLCTHGDCDGDGAEPVRDTTTTPATITYNHIFDDIAKYLYDNDLSSSFSGTQNVITYAIGFGFGNGTPSADERTAAALLTRATDSVHSHGQYYEANGEQALALALNDIIGDVTSVNSSFVAPVVPVSPENKIYSGERIYMGFFKPSRSALWSGNLKKYAVRTNADGSKDVVDVNGALATYVDNDNSGYDDRDGRRLGSASNGAFREADNSLGLPAAQSFWSSSPDGGDVEKGGVGDKLMQRAFTISSPDGNISGDRRNIYTFLGSSTALTDASNAFNTTNMAVTAAVLGLPGPILTGSTTSDINKLINYFHGFDTYSAGTASIEKRDWIMGDILHAKPLIVSYATFSFSTANESNCSVNKVMIYAGSNDGMLHAFKDCDGSEVWTFIPPDVLPDLQFARSMHHINFVDSTVTSYIYDANQDGTIDTAAGDKVVLLFGLRRGSGTSSTPTRGFYYALDVSDPAAPVFLWSIGNAKIRQGLTSTASTSYESLAESWSEPKIVTIKVGGSQKVAAFIGGGYENCYEDARFGSNQNFTDPCVGGLITTLDGDVVSSTGTTAVGTLTALAYRGRYVYAVEVATLNASTGVPSFTNGGSRIWVSGQLTNAVPSELAAIDMNYDGFAERLYAGDTGGNMWRFDISSTNTADWTTTKIFTSNPGYTDGVLDNPASNGRKIFYKPSAVIDTNNLVRLYFGTGDREHPLNRAVIDRFYELIDKGTTVGSVTHTYPLNEVKLVDVTTDLIQAMSAASGQTAVDALDQKLYNSGDPQNTTYYGWYIKLDGQDRNPTVANPGEKVYAPPYVANSVVYFTTYSPNISSDPTATCGEGNRGLAQLYAVDYRTGMAVFNYDKTNDTTGNLSAFSWNRYATKTEGSETKMTLRTDRHVSLGSGIASEPGEWIGREGSVEYHPETSSDQVIPVYWRQSSRTLQ